MQAQLSPSTSNVRQWLVSTALVAVLLALGTVTPVPRAQAARQSHSAPSMPAAELVRPDGAFDLTKGVSAAIDLRGWNVKPDPALGPVLVPTATGWSTLGQHGLGPGDSVFAVVTNATDVYVGGLFSTATNPDSSTVAVNNVAKWNGSTNTWSALGKGVDNTVWAIAVIGSDVYVGGGFTKATNPDNSTVTAKGLVKWNGSTNTWSALGKGISFSYVSPNPRVFGLAVSGSDVYVGGDFKYATNTDDSILTVNNVAKWNGSTNTWSLLARGVDDRSPVHALAASGGDVYVGGGFTTVNNADGSSQVIFNIAKWNGSTNTWSALGKGMLGTVWTLAVNGSDVYVGGNFTTVTNADNSTVTANNVAKWNGSTNTWSALGKGMSSTVEALAVSGSDVYVGGYAKTATNADGSTVTVNYIATWNGSTWSTLGRGVGDFVYALSLTASSVYAGGDFWTATNTDGSIVTANCVAAYSISKINTIYLPLILR